MFHLISPWGFWQFFGPHPHYSNQEGLGEKGGGQIQGDKGGGFSCGGHSLCCQPDHWHVDVHEYGRLLGCNLPLYHWGGHVLLFFELLCVLLRFMSSVLILQIVAMLQRSSAVLGVQMFPKSTVWLTKLRVAKTQGYRLLLNAKPLLLLTVCASYIITSTNLHHLRHIMCLCWRTGGHPESGAQDF